jgi:hypothetical protein
MIETTPTGDAPTFERPRDRADELRASTDAVRFLDLPPRRAIMIDGDGPPGEAAFAPRMPGLYAAAYSLRFALKRRGIDGRVGPLEGLWWTADETTDLDVILSPDRGDWRWTLLIGLPDEASDEEVETALATGRDRVDPAVAPALRVEHFHEGRVAQILHLGPYAAERPTIERLHAGIADSGLQPRGRHHELYLGDPRRSAPERLRTILRSPVR